MATFWLVKLKKTFGELSFDDMTREKFMEYYDLVEYQITSTKDLFVRVVDLLNEKANKLIDVNNIYYDKHSLVQSFVSSDNNSYEIIVKRQLSGPQDTYTFMEHDNADTDYTYINMTSDQLLDILISQHLHKGVYVDIDGNVTSMDYIIKHIDDKLGSLLVRMNGNIKEVKFINLQTIATNTNCKSQGDDDEKYNNIESTMNKLIQIHNGTIEHIFSYHNIGVGLLSFTIPTISTKLNQKISKILKSDIYGECYIGLADFVSNISRTIDIDDKLFDTILLNSNKLTSEFVAQNQVFCNVHHEI